MANNQRAASVKKTCSRHLSDDDDDIWEYKALTRVRKRDFREKDETSLPAKSKKTEGETNHQTGPSQCNANGTSSQRQKGTAGHVFKHVKGKSPRKAPLSSTPEKNRITHQGHCPICQMPFSALIVQSPSWHVSECMQRPLKAQEECKNGVTCQSSISSHFRTFTHKLLARARSTKHFGESKSGKHSHSSNTEYSHQNSLASPEKLDATNNLELESKNETDILHKPDEKKTSLKLKPFKSCMKLVSATLHDTVRSPYCLRNRSIEISSNMPVDSNYIVHKSVIDNRTNRSIEIPSNKPVDSNYNVHKSVIDNRTIVAGDVNSKCVAKESTIEIPSNKPVDSNYNVHKSVIDNRTNRTIVARDVNSKRVAKESTTQRDVCQGDKACSLVKHFPVLKLRGYSAKGSNSSMVDVVSDEDDAIGSNNSKCIEQRPSETNFDEEARKNVVSKKFPGLKLRGYSVKGSNSSMVEVVSDESDDNAIVSNDSCCIKQQPSETNFDEEVCKNVATKKFPGLKLRGYSVRGSNSSMVDLACSEGYGSEPDIFTEKDNKEKGRTPKTASHEQYMECQQTVEDTEAYDNELCMYSTVPDLTSGVDSVICEVSSGIELCTVGSSCQDLLRGDQNAQIVDCDVDTIDLDSVNENGKSLFGIETERKLDTCDQYSGSFGDIFDDGVALSSTRLETSFGIRNINCRSIDKGPIDRVHVKETSPDVDLVVRQETEDSEVFFTANSDFDDVTVLEVNPGRNNHKLMSTKESLNVESPAVGNDSSKLKQSSLLAFFSSPKKTDKPASSFSSFSVTNVIGGMASTAKAWAQIFTKPSAPSVTKETSAAASTPKKKTYSAGASQGYERRRGPKKCPFYKRMPGTPVTVDAFSYGVIEGCSAYFLSHFHYDHYGGLTGKFTQPIYCSQITGNLVEKKLRVKPEYIHRLPMNEPCVVENVEVTLLEANHCPGAVMFLFKCKNGQIILHVGDFRACTSMENYPELQNIKIDQLYLDTTYCDPTYTFPPQDEMVKLAVSIATEAVMKNPKTLIVCGSYTIGKEKIFLGIAESLNMKICVAKDKKNVLDCIGDPHIMSRLTTQWEAAQVHVLPMGQLRFDKLLEHLGKYKNRFTHMVSFSPTGWTHKGGANLSSLKPTQNRNNIACYGIPYSEHSSYSEMKRFVQFLRPLQILPTVNNGNPTSREKMNDIFKSWLSMNK